MNVLLENHAASLPRRGDVQYSKLVAASDRRSHKFVKYPSLIGLGFRSYFTMPKRDEYDYSML